MHSAVKYIFLLTSMSKQKVGEHCQSQNLELILDLGTGSHWVHMNSLKHAQTRHIFTLKPFLNYITIMTGNYELWLIKDRGSVMFLLRSKVNCNDDLGILEGKWQGSYKGGVKPTEWSNSADILHSWVSSNFSPVRYGQCWVFACVLCTGTL